MSNNQDWERPFSMRFTMRKGEFNGTPRLGLIIRSRFAGARRRRSLTEYFTASCPTGFRWLQLLIPADVLVTGMTVCNIGAHGPSQLGRPSIWSHKVVQSWLTRGRSHHMYANPSF